MEERMCSFCNKIIEPGTGKLYARRDGTVYYFCSSKCEKNMKLGRAPRRVEWAKKGW
ncbi:MAG: 50S ribosomal protein L24e [Euryarchaeota archaeon]|nr:50S ribosomal protein L24e [Euryarchaeota archaeon]